MSDAPEQPDILTEDRFMALAKAGQSPEQARTYALLSLAVSARRIADALDPTGERTSMNVPDMLFQMLNEVGAMRFGQ